MFDKDSSAYYEVRERQARDRAALAADPHVRKVHLEMAEHYAQLLRGVKFTPTE